MNDFLFNTTPMNHQREALQTANLREYFAYFLDPGLGKTKVVIDEAQTLASRGLIDTILVICPKSIMSTWAEEVEKHSATLGARVWQGGGWRWVIGGHLTATVYVINIDAVNRVKGSKNVGFEAAQDLLSSYPNSMFIIDESTIIKNPESKRTKAVSELGLLAKYRRILSGTPMANTPLDIYAQMKFLHPSAIFKYNFYAFRSRYAIMGGYENRQVMGYKNLEHLSKIIAQHSFRATKEQCLDLPERVTQIRHVELSSSSWKAYRALVDDLAIEIADSTMDISMTVKKITKLRQLTGGWVKDDYGVARHVGNEKFNELEHLLDECQGHKTIIWCQFTHEILAIQEKYPRFKVFHGGMTPQARDEARHAFEYGNAPAIVVQNDTGGMGITLNAASVSIFYSNPIYPLPKQQARDRNYRKGQDKSVTEYELLVEGSVDETIYNSIVNKSSLADVIINCRGDREAIQKALMPKLKKVDWRSPHKGH